MQQKSVPASADLNLAAMAEMVENSNRGGSRILVAPQQEAVEVSMLLFVHFNQEFLLTNTILVTIILSDDESAGAKSKADYSDLDGDVRASSDSEPSHVADNELADGNGLGSGLGAAFISDRLVTDHQDGHNDHDSVFDEP